MSAREGEERGRGIPRSEEERRERHERLYPGTPLPERGTGLSGSSSAPWIVSVLAIGFFVLVAITRKS